MVRTRDKIQGRGRRVEGMAKEYVARRKDFSG